MEIFSLIYLRYSNVIKSINNCIPYDVCTFDTIWWENSLKSLDKDKIHFKHVEAADDCQNHDVDICIIVPTMFNIINVWHFWRDTHNFDGQ